MNPFVYGSPLKPDQFVGRRQKVSTVLNRLANPNDRGSSAVSGPNRIGKTSFLQYIMQVARITPWKLLSDKAHFIFLDCTNIPLNRDDLFDETEFWRFILRTLEQKLPGDLKRYVQEILQSGVVADSFNLITLFEEIGAAENLVALFLDEFEYLAEHIEANNPRLLYTLRALINQPAPRGLALITASKERLTILGSRLDWAGSPFYNNFAFIELKPFSQTEVNELIDLYLKDTGVEFSDEDRDFIYDVSQGHPEQVQYACYLLFDKLSAKS